MKYQQAKVCATCRARKLGCDGKRPSCSQCLHTGQECAGYRSDTIFVSYTPNAHTKRPRVSLTKAPASKLTKTGFLTVGRSRSMSNTSWYSITKPVGTMTVQDFTAIILTCYVPVDRRNASISDVSTTQVCGAWVNVLPRLVEKARGSCLVASAVRTFGAAILERTPDGGRTAFQNFEAYNSTLYHLKDALLSPEQYLLETAVAIICLAMSELLFSTSQNFSGTHLNGLAALLESRKPEDFSHDFFHAIFVGSRPLLIFQAFFMRKPTFLAKVDWKIIPFHHHPPSDMQCLLGHVAGLPSILEEADHLWIGFNEMARTRAVKLKTDVLRILDCLSRWKDRFETDSYDVPGSSHDPQDQQDSDHPHTQDQTLWFPSLSTANLNIHVWAFELICLSEMERLDSFLRENSCYLQLENSANDKDIQTRSLELVVKICRSLEYLLQDEMRLHGPASAIFPLQVAYEYLSKNQSADSAHIQVCQKFFKRIRHRGYQARFPIEQECTSSA